VPESGVTTNPEGKKNMHSPIDTRFDPERTMIFRPAPIKKEDAGTHAPARTANVFLWNCAVMAVYAVISLGVLYVGTGLGS
jgi:hypothetical protein